MPYSFLTYAYNSIWFLDEASKEGLYLQLKNTLNDNFLLVDFSQEKKRHQAYVISATEVALVNEDEMVSEASQENSIAVIPIMGVITLQDQRCGPAGTTSIGKTLMDAAENSNIDSVILNIDSPGGEAHAMFDLSNSINEFKQKCKKPIVAYVGSMAASAAYGIAASCNEIICSDNNSVVGSIGSFSTIVDRKKSQEANGIFAEEIYAEDSSEKNIEIRSALAGDKKPMLATLKKFNDRFKNIVMTGRPGIISTEANDPMKGASIFAIDAITMNLIDGIGNMSTVKKRCSQLHTSNYLQTNIDMTKISFKSTMLAIASIFTTKVDGDEITEADVLQMETTLGERQQSIDDLNTIVANKQLEIANLNTKVADLTTGNNTLQAALTAIEVKIDALQAELNLRPGTTPTTPVVAVDPIAVTNTTVVDEINEEAKKYRK